MVVLCLLSGTRLSTTEFMHVSASREALRGGAIQTDAPRILLIGGEPSSTISTCEILESERYCVVHRTSGTEGLEAASQYPPALVILYLTLPDRDGIAVCRTIHTRFSSAILVVSPSHDEDSLVAMLDSGADDYVDAPVRPGELKARVRALLRRTRPPGHVDEILLFGGLEINVPRRRVSKDGERAQLTRTEFDILLFLARRSDRIQTQETILKAVWGPHHGEYVQTLRVHIGHIRRKLERIPSRPQYVVTEPGVGYYFSGSSPGPLT